MGKVYKKAHTPKKESFKGKSNSELKSIIEKLEKENSELDRRISDLQSQGITCDLQPQMTALHDYNEMKDLTQHILGYLADVEHITISELHTRYNLPVE